MPDPSSGRRTVLVVDDDELVRSTTRAILESRGYEVLTAGRSDEAVALYRKRAGEIGGVLIDLTLKGETGEATYAALRLVDPNVRVLFTSGYAEAETRPRLQEIGVMTFLGKPYDAGELIAKLEKVLAAG